MSEAPNPRAGLLARAALGLLAFGCSRPELVPVQGPARGAASVLGAGVELSADTRSEQRAASVSGSLVAVYIRVRNTGHAPVHVRLEDIELRASSWAERALAPAQIQPRRRVASLGMDPGSRFIAQQSAGAFGSRYGRTESVVLEPGIGARLPTDPSGVSARELARSAFDGGPIASGAAREGFVYFPELPRDARELRLRVGVRSGAGRSDAHVLEIAYVVRG